MPLFFNQNNGYNPYAQQGNGYGVNTRNQQPQQNARQTGMFGRANGYRQNQPSAMPQGRQMQPSAMPQGRHMQAPAMPQGQQMQAPAMPMNRQQPSPPTQPRGNLPNFNIGANPGQMPQSLPDGVRYEPLDANTMNLVKNLNLTPDQTENKNLAISPQQNQPKPQAPPLLQKQPEPLQNALVGVVHKIETFIQNERNASIFYQHLSDAAPREDYSRALDDIRQGSLSHNRVYSGLYQKYNGEAFSPIEKEIDTRVNFNDGIGWAIAEECKAIRELGGIMEHMEDEKDCRALNSVIYRKIADLGMLHLINTNRRIYFDGYQ